MTFKDYYKNLGKSRYSLRDMLIARCGISIPTFYTWIDNPGKIKPHSREIILEIFGYTFNQD